MSILSLETETVAGHTCKVIVLSGGVELDGLRASIEARLDRAPQLCMRLCEADGRPCWSTRQTDVNAHVVLHETAPCDEAQLMMVVADIFEQRLDRSRPLWRMDVVPQLVDGGAALIWRIHHALADGSTAMRIAGSVLWDEQPQSSTRPRARSPKRTARPVAHRRLGLMHLAARELPRPWLRSPLDGHVSARRAVAFATVELAALHRVARATHGATVNDAVLTVVAGGLRRWLEAQHGHLGRVRVKVPVSLHTPSPEPGDEASEPGNRDSFFCLDLPLESADPVERLDSIRRATAARKQGHDAQQLDALTRELAHVPPLRRFAERVLAHPRSFALNVSNVPGPRRPVEVLEVPVRALYSLAEIREHHALRVSVVSLADRLSFGLTADPTLLTGIDTLARGIEAEAHALTARVPT